MLKDEENDTWLFVGIHIGNAFIENGCMDNMDGDDDLSIGTMITQEICDRFIKPTVQTYFMHARQLYNARAEKEGRDDYI